MKKAIFVIIFSVLAVTGFTQLRRDAKIERSNVEKEPINDEKEPTSWLNEPNYENVKNIIRGRQKVKLDLLIENIRSIEKIDENRWSEPQLRMIENVVLDLYNLTNQEVVELLSISRKNNLGTNDKLDKQILNYIQSADEAFKQENIFLAQLNPANLALNNAMVRKSFDDYFDIVLDYAECMTCCPKKDFPDQRFFWFKPKYGKSITFSKAEYSAWYSHKICGFVIYNFPYLFKKSRFKLASFPGLLLTALCGRPRFRSLSPNGKEVHVPLIPVIMVLGLNNLATPPCQNQTLQNKLLGIIQVRN